MQLSALPLALLLTSIPAAPPAAPAAPRAPRAPGAPAAAALLGGTVDLELMSPQAAQVVSPGDRIDWVLRAYVSESDNLGLAMISVDVSQDPTNPELLDLPPGTGISPVMRAFDRPRGFANPGAEPELSGYSGTQVGKVGERNLVQIGGAQNTFGVTGPCLGPNGEICMGQDVIVTQGVGQSGGQLIALGSFLAPATPGSYLIEITGATATTLQEVQAPPRPSVVRRATTRLALPGFRFNVQ